MAKTADAIRLLSDRRSVDLEENLKYFVAQYDAILARYREELDGLETVRGSPWRRFGRLYYGYIQQQRDDAAAKLAQLETARGTPSALATEGHASHDHAE